MPMYAVFLAYVDPKDSPPCSAKCADSNGMSHSPGDSTPGKSVINDLVPSLRFLSPPPRRGYFLL
ncbi:hypothetical protein PROFUN_14148 [Planoprotostelium fungivorum]|uniref:Uncharacterized protein n=1 Tax=Planoprotostelium fungivorum TaxID=1890364 RepID=A0A2P6N1K9_9EUKA|nr:hypothetical protein PROFUN_14148 [Planoprotostelium fungivorum]